MTRSAILTVALLCSLANVALGQGAVAVMDPEDAVGPISIVEGPGVKVGEGTVLHPVVGVESGLVSNVFFEDATPAAAGIIRVLGELGAGSLSNQRLSAISEAGASADMQSQGALRYRFNLRLSYEFYPSDSERIRAQGGLGVGLIFRGIVRPQGTLRFGYFEDFQRVIRPPNFEARSNTNRDINNLRLQLTYAPRGRSVNGNLYYLNTIDVFEDPDQRFANRFQNTFGTRVNWQWLPLTRLYADVSWGVFTGLGSSTKETSFPLRALAGIQTVLTLNTTLSTRIGYGKGFYATEDFSNVLFGATMAYRYSPKGRVQVLYDYNFQDSINANFFRDHAFKLGLQQLFVPFVVEAEAEFRLRRYAGITAVMGPPTRDDAIFAVTAGIHYNHRNWLAFALDYRFWSVQTDYIYTTPDGYMDDPSFIRHELLLGVRAAL
jgi:hypothetical protein